MSAEWLVEDGIGEQRAIRLHNDGIVEARLHWPGHLTAGQVAEATLTHRSSGSTRGTATFPSSEEALVDRLPKDANEGAPIRLEITRAAIAERGRLKRAQARPSDASLRGAPRLAEQLGAKIVHRFPAGADWEDLFAQAWSGQVDYPGGALIFADTPAMTLVDIDGPATPANALAAVPVLAAALRRFDIGGSIGVDFPTLAAKQDRKAVDNALGEALAGWPHECTAMNGFGFVQIVARLERPSILQRIHHARVGAAARIVLRRAEQCDGPGTTLITCHPALKARLRGEWLTELNRRTGREVRIETDSGLALESGHAQIVGL